MNERKDKLKFYCELDYLQKPWWHMNSKSQNPLQKKLNDREWILADGATGTNLFNMGLSSGNAPEIWNRTEPKKIKALYQNSLYSTTPY